MAFEIKPGAAPRDEALSRPEDRVSLPAPSPLFEAGSQCEQPAVPSHRSFLWRVLIGLSRRRRLISARLRYPRVIWGSGCDVRTGFRLRASPSSVVSFGAQCVLDYDMTVECNGSLLVGARTIFGHHCTLASVETISIGEDCLIAELVSIRDHNHRFDRLDVPVRDQGYTSAPVYIGRNVWLGAKVTVVSGVRIGDNVIVGANAVVTKDIPANAVAVGVPARVVRMRA